ncbi:DUF3168 domain-containing protein [Sphingobium phenoxybenzoativorans]|uniref:DUF3168 domain-containing protein n=1 Tax=Sphingobium phenoxybenzoativorans TaxID=1592790 RepID=A0A975Q3C8_9SPHN|nr:DUF3168 domain-containing protein [Sphingobium phenoxybenzoativorans]QUT07915.1 DUF3168 domain-containing protein [Sphingobium phenoxybenzoativorans]
MDFQAGVRARLLANYDVRQIADKRVTWLERPQLSGLPAVTLQVVADPRPQNMKGFEGARSTDVQADCWAATYKEALQLARAVISCLAGPAEIEGKKFGNAQVTGQRDLGETVADGFVHRQSVDLTIRHVGD